MEDVLAFTDGCPEPILLISADGGIIAANRRLRDRFGISPSAIEGTPLTDLVLEDGQQIKSYLRACSRTSDVVLGSLRLRGEGGNIVRVRSEGWRYMLPANSGRQVVVVLRLLPRETSTARFQLLTERIDRLSSEVFARKRAEEELRDQKQLLEVTLRSIGDAVIATDVEGRITFLNGAAQQLTGWTAEDAEGRHLEEVFQIVHEITGDPIETPVHRVLRERAVVGLENHTMLLGRNGDMHPIDDTAAPIRDDSGQIRGTVLVFRDVRQRKESERIQSEMAAERNSLLAAERAARIEAERASRMKDEFLATLSHELRTPLNSILGYSTLLLLGRLDVRKTRDAVEAIERNARLQTSLIDDLLDVNRIVSGTTHLEVKQLHLPDVIAAALSSIQPSVDAKQLRLQTLIDSEPGPVRGDPARLQQIIWNLLTNAVKFTPRGGRIQLTVGRMGSHIEIAVADTGEGISKEFLPHVFERFRQADASSVRKHGGLGLGLAIVRHLIELHGGTVHATSPGVGLGATFVVRLPVAIIHPEQPSEEPSRISGDDIGIELLGIRVLVVDDDADSASLIQRVLEQCNASVEKASSASEALSLLDADEFDVFISDIGMPDEDGYQLMKRIRALADNPNRAIPSIALTAFARPEDRRQAALAGFQTHLRKPVEVGELLAIVANLAKRMGV